MRQRSEAASNFPMDAKNSGDTLVSLSGTGVKRLKKKKKSGWGPLKVSPDLFQ